MSGFQNAIIGQAGALKTPPGVNARLDGRSNSLLSQSCYCGFRLQQTGNEQEINASGSYVSSASYMTQGDPHDVWVERTITGGTPGTWNNLDQIGGSRVQLNADKIQRIFRSAAGTHTVQGYCRFYDASSGGNLLDQSPTATWSAENEFDPCPICCFTPETPITMENGTQMPIGKIRKGDRILVWDPFKDPSEAQFGEEVTGVIDRVNRTMYRVTFDDGRYLDMSEDHPLHIESKGPHSIKPEIEYKDVGLPEVLKVGDHASRLLLGTHSVVTSIEPIPYRGIVYTLENSLFYANGILVY